MTEPICSICKGPIDTIPSNPPWTGGCSAHPFAGRCCTDCDNRWVTPARMLHITPDSELIPILLHFAKSGSELVRALAEARVRLGMTVGGLHG
jgi:hypothetical protein